MTRPGEQPGWDAQKSIDDIFSDDPLVKAIEWVDSIGKLDEPAMRVKKLQKAIINTGMRLQQPTSEKPAIHKLMRGRALELCRVWDIDPVQNINRHRAQFGFLAVYSLAFDTGIIPAQYDNSTQQIEALKQRGRSYAENFGSKVFVAMEAHHPDAAYAVDRLSILLTNDFYVNEHEMPYQRAGMALAYALSASSEDARLKSKLLS